MSDALALDAGLVALRRRVDTGDADLAGLLAVLNRHSPAVKAIVAAHEAAEGAVATNDEKAREKRERAALDDARKALEAAGVSDLLRRRATIAAEHAIGAAPGEVDLNDRRALLDMHGRTVARAVVASHLIDLPIGGASTHAASVVSDHLRDQLDGRAGSLNVVDTKQGVKKAPPRRSGELLNAIAESAGKLYRAGKWGPYRLNVESAIGIASLDYLEDEQELSVSEIMTIKRDLYRRQNPKPKAQALKRAFGPIMKPKSARSK